MRRTIQRDLIREELKKLKSHPTAKQLYLKVKEKIPSLSFGTVYRTLNLMKKKGEAIELFIGGDTSRWDGDVSPHYHFVCSSCGEIIDVYEDISSRIKDSVKGIFDGQVEEVILELRGTCKKCLKKREK